MNNDNDLPTTIDGLRAELERTGQHIERIRLALDDLLDIRRPRLRVLEGGLASAP